jgi:hypothetical protein
LTGLKAGKDLALFIGCKARQVLALAGAQQVGLQITQVGLDVFRRSIGRFLLHLQGSLKLPPVDEEYSQANDDQRYNGLPPPLDFPLVVQVSVAD